MGSVREVDYNKVVTTVSELCMTANYDLGTDVVAALKKAHATEESPTGKSILNQILENAAIGHEERIPICQDTGFAVIFVELGEDVRIAGGNLSDAIREGVKKGYTEGYLRKSIVDDPVLDRKNTGDNTPPIVHYELMPGDGLKITCAPKGGGSENMSEVRMMKPADGIEGVKEFVVERVQKSGGNPCPPVVVGVGIGGTFEKCAFLAKKALIRPLGERNPDPRFAEVEQELLERINKLGIGPMGLGGRTTALGVHIETHPCHIASMPAAVNINCHATRHKTASL
jgi:fumarate hydratase subunit alpha